MTDITELAQREKFEAWFVNDVVGADVNFPAFKDGEYTEGEIYDEQLYFMLQAMWMAWKAAGAELVEALEKAQQENTDGVAGMAESYETTISMLRSRIAELESFRTAYMEWGDKTDWVRTDRRFDVVKPLGKHLADVLRAYIEHLESRTVAVKQGEVLVTVAGFTGCGKSAIAGEIEIAMKAIGVPVTWANGDSEKRMTGADWLTAIEMYKPTVRIVEVNIPRPAGIKVEAE